ncbi:MAG TPA: hypothetical protein VNV15_09155 [Opitutaceae bacterium]|jgi:hypothetical protein|nr:hypothetical protein [Opitutaceae bacterium]
MTLRRIAAIGAVLWVVVLAAVYWERRDLGRLRHLLAERTTKCLEAEAQIQAMIKRGAAALETNSTLSLAIDKLRADQKALAANASDGNERAKVGGESAAVGNGSSDFRAIVAKDPELRQLYLKGFVADLYTNWGPLFKQQGLSPDQIDKLNAIQLKLEEEKLDLSALAETEGVSMDDPDISAQAFQDRVEARHEIHSLLGNAGYSAYRTLWKNQSALMQANDLITAESATADPLTAQQTGQLTQILADASTRDKSNFVVYGTVNWQTAMPRVQAVLTPAQYEALQVMQAQKAAQLKLQQFTNPPVGPAASHP